MEENIISAHEAADLLGITQRAVTGLLERGTLIGRKLGREWAIARQSVLDYKARKQAQQGQKEE